MRVIGHYLLGLDMLISLEQSPLVKAYADTSCVWYKGLTLKRNQSGTKPTVILSGDNYELLARNYA